MRTRIVVPCYNEADRFDPTAFDRFLASSRDVGFVLVNDGSTDRTMAVLTDVASRWPDRVNVIDQQPNGGKAEAVRVGMLAAFSAGSEYVGYFDADLATPLDAIDEFVETLRQNEGIDIVIGARLLLLGRQIKRKATRHYLGRVFATAASIVLDLPVYDTQCGAKLFRANDVTRALFAAPFGSRWIFDVEIFARYLNGPGSRDALYELPLRRWSDVGESKVRSTDFIRAFAEMASIYRSYRLRRDARLALRLVTSPVIRYAAAGAVGTAVHFATLTCLVEFAHAPATVATAAGSLLGAVVNYFLNYYLTFASRVPHARTFPRFFAVAAFSAGLNFAGMWVFVDWLRIYYLTAQVLCTLTVLFTGYALNKLWTFASSRREAPAETPELTRRQNVDRLVGVASVERKADEGAQAPAWEGSEP